jgi:hypothetical protein
MPVGPLACLLRQLAATGLLGQPQRVGIVRTLADLELRLFGNFPRLAVEPMRRGLSFAVN